MPRNKVDYRMAGRENYKVWKAEDPTHTLSYTEWANIIYTFNYNFRDYLLETGYKASLPWGCGWYAISKRRMKNFKQVQGETKVGLPIDWGRWREDGKIVYMLNSHTEGFRFKWRWFITESRFSHPEIWVFKPYRVTSRMLTHYLRQEEYQFKYQEW